MDVTGATEKDFSAWVPWGDAWVHIKYLSAEELEELREKCTTRTWDRRHQLREQLDRVRANVLLGRAAVLGWEHIQVRNDAGELEEYPFTQENLDTLMTRAVEFSRFVNEVCTDMVALGDARRENREKNSDGTSGRE